MPAAPVADQAPAAPVADQLPAAPGTQEVSFLREIWQAMKDQNVSTDDMLAAMAPVPGQ